MTAPKPRQWPLAPALRYAAFALLLAGAALMVQGWLSTAMWLAAVVLLVLAAVQLVKNWRRRM
jgi:hypothetical protein